MQDDPGTRARILETARRLFHEQGYAATGISTILREADAHAGSLYHFFPSKEALLEGVLAYYNTLLEPLVTGPVERAEADPVARVFALLAFYRAELERTACRMGCPIGNLALEVSDGHPAARPLVERNFALWRAVVARWLEEARDRLPRDAAPADLAHFVLTVMEGAVMQARAAGSLAPFDASVAGLRRHFALLEEAAARERSRSGGVPRPTRPRRSPASRRRRRASRPRARGPEGGSP
jgi:TetR/AcrR family transcriptional repressor of nem operon